MLKDADAVATVAVRDLNTASRFYEETLGLPRVGSEDGEAITLESGNTAIRTATSWAS
jgi:catechol 2,3-dioxygenase-like lactoylglutathione lyase family enzyme